MTVGPCVTVWIVTFADGETVTGTSCVSVAAAKFALAADVAVTVITAVPGATAVTTPAAVTVATPGAVVPYVIVAVAAPAGCVAEAASCAV